MRPAGLDERRELSSPKELLVGKRIDVSPH